MSLRIGRLDFRDGMQSWSATGPDLNLNLGDVLLPPTSLVTDADRRAWIRVALISLAGMADEVVPIVASEWPQLDGMYRVTSAPSTLPVTLADGVFTGGSVTARRVSGGVARCGLSVLGGARPVTAPVTAFPAGNTYGNVPGWVGSTATAIDASYTDADGLTGSRVAVASPANTVVPAEVPVDNWYAGSARVEVLASGSNWIPIHGIHVPPGANIRIGNGLVRLTLKAKATPVVNVDPLWEQWNGSSWESVPLTLTDTSGLISHRGFSGVEVIRNDVGVVSLRLWGERVLFPSTSQAVPWRAVFEVRGGIESVNVTTETSETRWNHATATVTALTSGSDYGVIVNSTPAISVVSDARVAFASGPPSHVRAFAAGAPNRWALVRRAPSDRIGVWHRWSAPVLRVVGG